SRSGPLSGLRSARWRRFRAGCPEEAVQRVAQDGVTGFGGALTAEDAGGQAVGQPEEGGDLGARVPVCVDLAGLLSGGESGGEEVLECVGGGDAGCVER